MLTLRLIHHQLPNYVLISLKIESLYLCYYLCWPIVPLDDSSAICNKTPINTCNLKHFLYSIKSILYDYSKYQICPYFEQSLVPFWNAKSTLGEDDSAFCHHWFYTQNSLINSSRLAPYSQYSEILHSSAI